jgi:hypothetical protein
MVFLKNAGSSIPIGLENWRSPLGHSGHLKLQLVVGSMAMLIGKPIDKGFLVLFET